MRKKALGLNDMRIPGLPNPSEKGLGESDLQQYSDFFGGLDEDSNNENSSPTTIKTKGSDSKEDERATAYFNLLYQKTSSKR